ncbi:Protein of unknown function (DUF2420) [Teratosphaeria destructans]|uniref:Uncharacterized protein n=1 Tax=Teratosphaeria destructans TaxID=418781 RepID=A0A9W7SKR1_9PEZI|nr:Protein of unknown function (DUF2420) [Teratosphaeria destructans]
MAATTAFPTLSVPQEDSMDMSSPHNAYNDGDIDLDFDFDGGVNLPEDERMLTDGEQTRPGTATDDMMEDDVQVGESYVGEAVMDDDTTIVPHTAQDDDEELIDYDDDDVQNEQAQPTGDQALPDVETVDYGQSRHIEQIEQPQEFVEQADQENVRQPEEETVEELEPVVADERETEAAYEPAATQVDTAKIPQTEGLPIDDTTAAQVLSEEPAATTTDVGPVQAYEEQTFDSGGDTEGYAEEEQAAEPRLTLDTSTRAASIEAPGTPTDTGLHPMTLLYEGISMPLFKSKRQLDGLLKDDNLANLSLHDLMHNIRERLARRIGNVPEEQDLTLAFDHMNLLLVGNSRAAFEYSLSDVLAVYLDLHQNDGSPAEEIPSLSLILSQNHFSSQLSWLKQAAASGLSMSTVVQGQQAYMQLNSEHDAEDGDETYADHRHHEYAEEGREGAEYTGFYEEEQHEQGEEGEQQLRAEDTAGQAESNEAQGQQAQLDEERQLDERKEEGLVATDPDGSSEPVGSAPLDNAAGSAGSNEAPEHGESLGVAEGTTDAVQAPGEVDQTESDASSATLNGEAVDDSNGEYDPEELIDWDDDSDLTSPFSEPAKDGHDDYPSAKEHEHTEDPAVLTDDAETVAQHGENEASNSAAGSAELSRIANDDVAHHVDSEDHVTELEQPHIGDTGEQVQHEEYGYDDQTYRDEADPIDEQHAQSQEPGKDEEPSYPDHEYEFNGDSYEHGLEHNPSGEETQVAESEGDGAGEDCNGDDILDFDDDDIGFNDDTPAEAAAREAASRKASQSNLNSPLSGSPSVKRSFDETAEIDFDFEEPDLKKVKSE